MYTPETVFDAFQISEREGSKAWFTKVGVGYINKDHSINVYLDAFPKDGKVHLRDRSQTQKNPGHEFRGSQDRGVQDSRRIK